MSNGTLNVWPLEVSFFNIPIIGRLCNQILGLLYDVLVRFFRLLFPLGKRDANVIVHFLVLHNVNESASLTKITEIVKSANTLLLPSNIQLQLGEVVYDSQAPDYAKKPSCNLFGWLHDLWRTGGYYDRKIGFKRTTFFSRSLCVVVVESFNDKFTGCGLGPFTDYLQITVRHHHCLAHEVLHKLGLMHVGDRQNIMHPACNGRALTARQSWFARLSSFLN